MKNTKRSAFTIVELVIVIAVIAILSAVLIPTFGAIIKDANEAADKTAASTLTSELHVYLKGNTIDSEDELMAVLNDSGIGEKLVPKAVSYGYHFWFDMENQMIIAGTTADVLARKTSTASVESGVHTMALTRGVDSINVSFREIVREGYFFIDYSGSAIATLLNNIDKINSEATYKTVTDALATLEALSATEDLQFAKDLKAAVEKTAIITESYSVVPSGATGIYFDPGIKFINDNGSLAGLPDNSVVVLPSTVISVNKGALDFGTSNITLVTSCKNENDVEFVFANASTNATIKTADGDFKIAQEDGTVTIDETNALANKIVAIVNGVANTTVVPNITLSGKLPYKTLAFYVKGDGNTDSVAFQDGKIYINYGYYAGNAEKNVKLYFKADGAEEEYSASHDLIEWTGGTGVSADKGVITVSTDAGDTATITANYKNIDGEKKSIPIEVCINKIQKANVKFLNHSFNATNNGSNNYPWNYVGVTETVFDTKNNVNEDCYTYKFARCNGNPTIALSVDGTDYFTTNGSQLGMVLGNNGIPSANGKTVAVKVVLDGCLTHTINLTVADNTNAVYQPNFKWHSAVADQNNVIRYYYVGNADESPINLSDILTYASGTFEKCTLKINGYASGGLYYPANSETYDGEVSVKINGQSVDTLAIADANAWNATTIQFSGKTVGNQVKPIIIEVIPDNTEKIPTLIEVVVVDGKNCYSVSDIQEAFTAETNAIMFADVKVDDGTKLEVGDYKLYGNGHKIDASEYDPPYIEWCTYTFCNKLLKDCSNKGSHRGLSGTKSYAETRNLVTELISVNEGTIDNVYINGPVFSNAQYMPSDYTYNSQAYTSHPYVSGIKVTGNAIISNSYVSGFRQPVQISGTTSGDGKTIASLDNVTLYGGNIANLSLVSGNVYLNNVTTVQEVVDVGGGKYSFGFGILGEEETGIKCNITIDGNFRQYNWMTEADAGKAPNVKLHGIELPLGTLLPAAFSLNETSRFIQTSGSERYINTGIIRLDTMLLNWGSSANPNDISGQIVYGENCKITNPLDRTAVSMSTVADAMKNQAATIRAKENPTEDELSRASKLELAGNALKIVKEIVDCAFDLNTYGPTNHPTPLVAPGEDFDDSNNFYAVNYKN